MDLTQLTPTELNKLTKDQLIAGILEDQTYSDVNLVKDKHGNNIELTKVIRDALTGNLVSSKTVRWTYYSGGEVDEITVQEGNRQRVIKHFTDGEQPVVTKSIVVEETLGDRIFEAAAGGASGAASGIKGLFSRILRRA